MAIVTIKRLYSPGIGAAFISAVFFGASTPLAKILAGDTPAILLAGLLYLGSGLGLSLWWIVRERGSMRLTISRHDLPWLVAAVVFGGIAAPILLMVGITSTPGSTASLLLNFEAVFTAMLAWFAFHENFDRRIALGFVLIIIGCIVLSWQPGVGFAPSAGWLAIIGACACWGMDNNLTQKISAVDPLQIAGIKGLVAGTFNVTLALSIGNVIPRAAVIVGALSVGLVGYGVSLVLFVVALRHIGTARTSAYFSVAPFVGAILSLLLFDEFRGPSLLIAGVLMAAGVWLHLTEHHSHEHVHTPMTHSHRHTHDEHHQYHTDLPPDSDEPHTHIHEHVQMIHAHPHYPDIHHRHDHKKH
jgi:drug/metabolite transporter (DMT)-like permease